MSNGICARQNEDYSIKLLAAQRQLYSEAKFFLMMSIFFSVLIPFFLSVVFLYNLENQLYKDLLNSLNVLCLLSLFFVHTIIKNKVELAAYMQQIFDLYVFSLPWNDELYGLPRNVANEVEIFSKKIINDKLKRRMLKNWYSTVWDKLPLNLAILSCQKENYAWDIKLRKRFKNIILIVIVILFCLILRNGFQNLDVVSAVIYSISFFAPILSWLLEVLSLINEDITTLENLDEILKKNDAMVSMFALQNNQRLIFEHRKKCYLLPDFFYMIFKDADEDNVLKNFKSND